MTEKKSIAKSMVRERLRFDSDWRFHLGDVPGHSYAIPIKNWRFQVVGKEKPKNFKMAAPNFPDRNWKTIQPWKNAFGPKPGFGWFRTLLPDAPGPGRILHFVSICNDGTIFLNGRKLLHHEIWTDPFDVSLDPAWNQGGPNHLAVLVKSHWGGGFIGNTDLELPVPPVTWEGPASLPFNNRSWRKIHLPHDFVVEGRSGQKTNDPAHGFLPKGVGWYRKEFEIPAKDRGKTLWIDFDGVFRNCRVWLNGRLLGRHRSGYTSFRFDITDAVMYGGRNVLAVRVDARGHEGWWYEGGGIYRHVWLNKANPLHVEPWGVYVVSTLKDNKADLSIQTTVTNKSQTGTFYKLTSEILDPKGEKVLKISSRGKLSQDSRKEILHKVILSRPLLWSLENPRLYKMVTKIEKDGRWVDRVETSFGVRSIRFDKDKGFFLNGKHVLLKGTCNHQDHAGVGVALPDRLFTYRLEKLKEMGSNSYRCSHNPPASELLEECDRLGMLVLDENRHLGDSREVLSQLTSMVLRDRNHPSIIAWSLCNEEGKQGTEEGRRMGMAMKKTLLKLDKTRPITCAMNGGWGEGLTHVVDLQGFNYNIVQYDPFRAQHPRMPMFGSETGSTVSTRGIYQTDRKKGYVSAYDVNHTEWSTTAENAWRPVVERPHMAGVYVWTGFDYKGEPTPYGWPCVNSHFGILDLCGFPKDNFHYYRAWWGDKPVLHLFPHWNWKGMEGKQIDVWCHTNHDQVELFLNGKSRGIKEMPRNGHLEWKVWYVPGVLRARAYRKGVFTEETLVETTGSAAAIRLTPYCKELQADGEDLAPVTVEILDEKGRLVPTADNEVKFQVRGAGQIAGVGNGDPSSHEPDKSDKRKAFNGLCAVYVQAGEKPGRITLTARSKGLKPAAVVLVTKKN